MATLDDATMGDASLAASGLSPIPIPPAPAVSGFYATAAQIVAPLLGFIATQPLKVIRESRVRPDPALPPSLVANIIDDCIGYVTGAKPVRNALGDYSDAAVYRVWIDPATIDEPPAIDDLIEVSGERYVVRSVQRLPAAGPAIVAWKLTVVRGQ